MSPFTEFAHVLARALAKHRRRRTQRHALDVAMWRFARLHPHWHEALFDEAFLARLSTEAIGTMEPVELAREWTRQFRYHDQRHRNRDIRRITPVAESFLSLLSAAERELGGDRANSVVAGAVVSDAVVSGIAGSGVAASGAAASAAFVSDAAVSDPVVSARAPRG